jgi:hypothetical protein
MNLLLPVRFGAEPVQNLEAEEPATASTLPAGSLLYVRLKTPLSTKTSHLRDPVEAEVVREVATAGGVVIPLGATLRGDLARLIPSSHPTDRARLRLRFTRLEIPGQPPLEISGRVAEVENARETVLPDGTIQGVLASELPLTFLENALGKWQKSQPDMGGDAQKMGEKAMGKADTSIEFPAGTDLHFVLDKPLPAAQLFPTATAEELPATVAEPVARLLAHLPQRNASKDGKPGDPINLVFVGNAAEIRKAFEDAGWTEPEALSGKSLWETVRAVAANQGYGAAPVSQLYLFGRPEDLAFQKMLNTFAERHHLRLWRSPATTGEGREIWVGAATHDVGWDIRPGVVSHAIDPEIDKERDKVGADLVAGGHVSARALVTRPDPLSEGLTATGATWKTDGRLLALELK